MTRANGGLIFQGLMWLESNAVANACLDASNPSQGITFLKLKQGRIANPVVREIFYD